MLVLGVVGVTFWQQHEDVAGSGRAATNRFGGIHFCNIAFLLQLDNTTDTSSTLP